MAPVSEKKHKRSHRTSGSSKKSRKKKVKAGNNRQQYFEAEGADSATQQLGTELEYKDSKTRTIICAFGMLASVVLIILDIRDDGMILKVGGLEFFGSMVGLAMFVLCAVVLWFARPKVKLKK